MFKIYIFIIFLCFASSIFNRIARQRFLWAYLGFILFSEILIFSKVLPRNFYNQANCIHVIFMCLFFKNEFLEKINKILLTIISIFSLFILIEQDLLKINTDIFKSFVFIFLSIYWFAHQIKNPNDILIYKKMTFWISFSILLWSTVFIIRVVPAHFFAELDEEFLKFVNIIYQWTTILSYLLFFRALCCSK